MDLLAITRTMWRHKVLSLGTLVLTVLGLVYVIFLTPREYQATSSTVLFPPPAPPSAEAIEKDPTLAGVDPSNPFSQFGDPSVIIDVVARRVSTKSAEEALVAEGADPRYEVAASVRYGSTSPIVEIVGVGGDPATATRTVEVVQNAVETELRIIQEEQGVNPQFMITPYVVDAGEKPELIVSGMLRSAVAVLGVGAIALFIMLSVAVALEVRQAERSRLARLSAGPAGSAHSLATPPEQSMMSSSASKPQPVGGEPIDVTTAAPQSPVAQESGASGEERALELEHDLVVASARVADARQEEPSQ